MFRIALCQLESHPALTTATAAYLEEPFVPSGVSLAQLGTQGLDVQALQTECVSEYTKWHRARISAVLQYLDGLDRAPDLLIFPELSIPVAALSLLGEWSRTHRSTVIAGSHTPSRSSGAVRAYASLGIDRAQLNQLFKYESSNCIVFLAEGRASLLPKGALSIFERLPIPSTAPAVPLPRALEVRPQDNQVGILPLNCAEALQFREAKGEYRIIGLVSYDPKPEQFEPFLREAVRNQKIACYVNDGRFGGSRLAAAEDDRAPSWFRESFPEGLPAGDCLFVADVDLDVFAVEVGTAQPRKPFEIVRLVSLAYAGSSGEIATELSRLRGLEDTEARASQLADLLKRRGLSTLHRKRIECLLELERRGVPSEAWWKVLGEDCGVGLRPLRLLEADLAAKCARELLAVLASGAGLSADAASAVVAYLAECQRRAGDTPATSLERRSENLSLFDRDPETARVHEFLDDRGLAVLEISGLAEIGKSAVVKKSLAQSGLQPVVSIRLTETSSPDFLALSILQLGDGEPRPPYRDVLEVARSAQFANALRNTRVLVLERVDLLLRGGGWRDSVFPELLSIITQAAARVDTKLIFETRRELTNEFLDLRARARLHVRGLDRDRLKYGVSLFDAQLRRVGLAGTSVDEHTKEEIVSKLGGHPVAVALAADASYEEGLLEVLDSLRVRRGFILNFVADLARALNLADEERLLLRLLCRARVSIPREVLLGAVDFPAGPHLRNLIALGAVEVGEDGLVEIASVLRDLFEEDSVPPDAARRFHARAAAAFAALAAGSSRGLTPAVEAEYHGRLAGIHAPVAPVLLDASIATAIALMAEQRYEEAAELVEALLRRKQSLEVLRIAAEVEARRNRFPAALAYARKVFERDRRDSELLAELAKIALTQFQEGPAHELVEIARKAGVEDVSLLLLIRLIQQTPICWDQPVFTATSRAPRIRR